MVDGLGYLQVYISLEIVMAVTQICTVEALQKAQSQKVYRREDAMLCCFDAQCDALWAARAL